MFLPVGLNVEGRLCLLVGAGKVAAHKAQVLLAHGARLRVVSPAFNDDPVWNEPAVERIESAYEEKFLEGVALAIAATDERSVNRSVAQAAQARSIFVLTADAPELCDWTLLATLRRGAFSVSFGTDGLFPALAARVKRDAAAIYGEDLARLCEEARRVKALDARERPTTLAEMAATLDEFWFLNETRRGMAAEECGKVYLVGAGPGDLGLITVKGTECLRKATVVVHDALANNELLDLYCGGALRIDVSKRKGRTLHMQPEINQILVDWARKGHTVVRLKGGDPMIFGRGGEEARTLAAAGINFEVVPGVSSLSAVPAYAGIPVTDRDYGAASLGVYSLHRKNGGGLTDDQWRRMADGPETLVLFMGMTVLETAVNKLIQFGRSPETPVALITQGTLPGQNQVTATLATISALPEVKTMPGPGLIVVGSVVSAHELMSWFKPPLRGTDLRQHGAEAHCTATVSPFTQKITAEGIDEEPLEITLVRHAEVAAPYRGRYVGSIDVELSELGKRQAATLAGVESVVAPELVFASPLTRVQQTLAAARPNADAIILEELREIRFGSWEGRSMAEIAADDPAGYARWLKIDGSLELPGGDSIDGFQQRVAQAARTIVATAREQGKKRITVFAHGMVIRFLLAHWIGLPLPLLFSLDISYASVHRLRIANGHGYLTGLNSTDHLRQL